MGLRTEILPFIDHYINDKGYAPTVREIMTHFHFPSTSSAYNALLELQQAGLVMWEPKKIRTLRLTSKNYTYVVIQDNVVVGQFDSTYKDLKGKAIIERK